MKKILVCLLLCVIFFNTQSGEQKQDDQNSSNVLVLAKSKLADNALLFGSAAIIAGGCFFGRKHISGLAWVTKKYFDQKMNNLVTGVHDIRTDIMQLKSHLHTKIDRLERLIKDEFCGVNSKLGAQDQKLTGLNSKLDQLQENANSAARELKSLNEKLDALERYLKNRNF